MKLTLEDMTDLARGSAFLGTGGGGDPYAGRLFAENMIRLHGAPELVHPRDIPDDANVFIFGMIGAPTVLIEKLMNGAECDLAIDTMEKMTGRKADYIISAEIGGLNSVIPVAMAARRGLPVVDADGMGRAFPEIQMTTFNVYGVPISPIVIVNDHLESVVINANNAKSGEGFARAVAIQMGLAAMLSAYPMTGKQVKETAVHGTLGLACGIGKAIVRGRHEGDPVDALLAYLRTTDYYNKCAVLFDGKVVDLLRETTGGFSVGRCLFEALDGSGRRMEVKFQNEHLIARDENGVKTIVPDLICMVDRETAEPITTEALKYGQRLKVIGVSAAPAMRTPEALACFGPHAFGLSEPFQPIEELMSL
ncbi:DUF917 domain-containing protein [Govanella unica]|uniref:DUF917 domain-containing protein n=1 Tax=Govanella unica TaxID=2975056 RepID=A0A9X3TXX0_9PROT|nr:DUF917 domain-containing protein [Govania unica]MDA5194016.1 DUF917 domain-containing protein [Govania unica]